MAAVGAHKAPLAVSVTLGSLARTCAASLPFTFSLAISVPGCGSYPACIMALLARVAPIQMSFSFSNRMTRTRQRASR